MTRSEHLEWCKQRANELLDANDVNQAWASMVSDMGKHDETAGHVAIEMGMAMVVAGHLKSVPQMREYIDGFN